MRPHSEPSRGSPALRFPSEPRSRVSPPHPLAGAPSWRRSPTLEGQDARHPALPWRPRLLAHALLPACGGVTAAGVGGGSGHGGDFPDFHRASPSPATVLPSDSIPAVLFSRKGSGIRRGSGGAAAGPPPRPQPAPPRAAPLVAPPAGAQGQLHFSPPAARKLASPRILRLPLPSCAAAPGPPQPPPRDCLPSPSPPAPPARRARTRVAAAW